MYCFTGAEMKQLVVDAYICAFSLTRCIRWAFKRIVYRLMTEMPKIESSMEISVDPLQQIEVESSRQAT